MKPKLFQSLVALALLALCILNFTLSNAEAQGTAFTYSGRMTIAGDPANGLYDLKFSLFNAPSGGAQIGSTIDQTAIGVTNGLLNATLDFGPVFTGNATWLEIAVRTNGGTAYSDLDPLQPLTPAPYAIFANTASNVSGTATLADNLARGVNITNANIVNSTVAGNGAGLTNLNASQFTTGTVPLAALGNAWQIFGNVGTTPGQNFLGTTDDQPLELWVNDSRAFRLEPGISGEKAPNVIGGSSVNSVANGVSGATIAGGGEAAGRFGIPFANSVTADFGTVGGGSFNSAQATYSTVAGGNFNSAAGTAATVSGGYQNDANSAYSVVAGGSNNVVVNGADSSFLGSGQGNEIESNSFDSVIAGGSLNTIATNCPGSIIGGGSNNLVGSSLFDPSYGQDAVIAGGDGNLIVANYGAIGGGYGNAVTGEYGAIPGGWDNFVEGNGGFAAGKNNFATGGVSVALGQSCFADGDGSFALGQFCEANDNNSFLWGDGSRQALSQGTNSFAVLATGGVWFYTGAGSAGIMLAPGSSSWATISDRNAKKNIVPVDYQAVLSKLATVPIEQWNYNWEKDTDVPHIGPMAQDFKGAFYPGRSDKSITTLEFDGVELAAIQALNQKLNEKEVEIKTLKERTAKVDSLEKENLSLAARLDELEETVKKLAARN